MAAELPVPNKFNAAWYFIDRHLQEGRGEKRAFECGEEIVSYAQLHECVNRFGNALRRSLGVRIEERILLLLQDTPDFACCFFGAIKIGAVPVPVNTLLKPHDYEYLLNDSRARVMVVSQALRLCIDEIPRERLPFLDHIVVAGGYSDGASLSALCAGQPCELNPAPTCKDDAAFWLYSSGSTGLPKACIHLHHDMMVAAQLYARGILDIAETDRFFSVAKLFFAYGLGNSLYFPLAVGATSILLPGPPSPQSVFEVIERHRPTLFFSVPSNFVALLNHVRPGADFDLSSIRNAVSAGEALPAPIFERFRRRFGVEILDGVGSTEALHIFISNRPGEARAGCSGQLVPGCEAKLFDEHGARVPAGEIGNLWIKYDSVCAAYWNQHDRTKDAIEGHWISTGDKFRQDEQGYFWYAGRSDDMLKVSGAWVSPAEIEWVLMLHEAVAEVAVVGCKDQDQLVKPTAWVVVRQGFSPSAELSRELQEFVLSRLPVYKRPRAVKFISELPKTATGKIQRFKLRAESGLHPGIG